MTPADEATTPTAASPPINRMVVALAGMAGVMIAAYMSLHKLGLIESIACGTGACESVQSSRFAVFLGVPVPFWGMAGYGTITALALYGLQPRTLPDRLIGIGLLVMTSVAFVFSAYLSWLEEYVIQAWCRWCIASAAVATLTFLAALPELSRLRRARRP
jgi:uncharacterized membrane protein